MIAVNEIKLIFEILLNANTGRREKSIESAMLTMLLFSLQKVFPTCYKVSERKRESHKSQEPFNRFTAHI
jgi:hypothetical protein